MKLFFISLIDQINYDSRFCLHLTQLSNSKLTITTNTNVTIVRYIYAVVPFNFCCCFGVVVFLYILFAKKK